MNHIPMRVIASPAVRPAKPTRRALAKQRTREKVLAAARQLFTERGYEGATIRDIAKAAGMSTGAVFASFADKSELFDEILAKDYALLGEAMQDAAQSGATVTEALSNLFGVAYRFHMSQLPLLQAGIAASWTRSEAGEQRNREALRPLMTLISDTLTAGVERGELSAKADLRLVSGIIWDVYLAGYRHAVFDSWSADDLTSRLSDQINLILAGVRS
jgi:AcrR family transcriptional regulator